MKKIVTAVGGMLIGILAMSQEQDSRLLHTQVQGKGIEVASRIIQLKLPYTFTEQGTIEEAANDKLYSANVKGRKLHGDWQSWYPDGLPCDSGTLIKNLPDGEWKHWNKEGQLIAIRNYDAGKFHQVLEEILRYNPKRNFYYLSTLFQKNRQAALHYLDVSYSFPGNNAASIYSSLKELVSANISGKYHYKPVFEKCIQDGLYMNFFADGNIKDSGYYKNGVRYGKWILRDSAGSNWQQGAYHNGSRIKEWKVYNNDNKLLELIFYNNTGQVSWRKRMNRQ
ncbi:MAG: hypothetical protein LH619_00690 [Chitinophagaceae bacterium]|nr:hypothetical protein [Chitinophagaceae bacterium]